MTVETATQETAGSLVPGDSSVIEEQVVAAGGQGITNDQHRDMVLHGLKSGVIDLGRANEELKLVGAAPLTAAETGPAPTALDIAKAADAGPGFEACRVQDFELPDLDALSAITALDPEVMPLTAAERMQVQEEVGGWLAEGGLPASVGSFIARDAGKFIQENPKYYRMDESGVLAHRLGELAKLQKLWGSDNVQKNVDMARALVAKIEEKRPGLRAFLDRTGLGNNATTIIHLANQAKRASVKG